jgi:hypothetical protein
MCTNGAVGILQNNALGLGHFSRDDMHGCVWGIGAEPLVGVISVNLPPSKMGWWML